MIYRKNKEPRDRDLYYDTYLEYIEEYSDGNWDYSQYNQERLARQLLNDIWCDDVIGVKEGDLW